MIRPGLSHRLLLCCISILLLLIAFPDKTGEGVSWLVWVCLVPWVLALKGTGRFTGLLLGSFFGFFFFFGLDSGVPFGLSKHLATSDWNVWVTFVLCCAQVALPYALFGLLEGMFQWLGKPFGAPRAAGCLTLLQVLIPQVLPISHYLIVYNSPFIIQVTDLGGVPLLLFILNLANFYLVDQILVWLKGEKSFAFFLVFALLIGATLIYGKMRLDELHEAQSRPEPGRIVRALSIQPDIASPFSGNAEARLRLLLQQVERGLEKFPSADFVIWPENPLNLKCSNLVYRDELKALVEKSGKPILFQCDQGVGQFLRYSFNAMHWYQPGEDVVEEYHKIRMFPFGETLPFSREIPFIKRLVNFYTDYLSGLYYRVFKLGDARLIPSICYEAVFSSHIREFVRRDGNLIVNSVNDAWWGDSDGPEIHLALSVFRSVEFRVPMVRVTNSGVGAFVQATGEIIESSRTSLFQKVETSFPLYLPKERSPYFNMGDWMLALLLVVFILDTGFRVVKNLKK